MNFRNLFRKGTTDNASSDRHDSDTNDSHNQHQPEFIGNSDTEIMQDRNISEIVPWYERYQTFMTEEISFMSETHPDFILKSLEDNRSTLNGALCWQGTLRPQIMEEMEWDVILMYQGIGGGKGDWAGVMSIYLVNPSFEQIIDALGYVPKCIDKDADGAYTLVNSYVPGRYHNGINSTLTLATEFCTIIERMSIGDIPDNYLSDYLPSLNDSTAIV
jgi:hypothetical protein